MTLVRSLTKANPQRAMTMPVLEQERQIMAVADAHNWEFRVLGVAPVPTAPVFYDRWWLVPAMEDKSPIPAPAMDCVQAIYAAGIHPKAFVIAHQAAAQLAPPADAPRISRFEIWAAKAAKHSVTALKVTGAVVAVAVPVVVTVLGVSALLALGLAEIGRAHV